MNTLSQKNIAVMAQHFKEVLDEPSGASASQYQQLIDLEQQPLILNREPAECNLCRMMTPPGLGVILVNCLHSFCNSCLKAALLKPSATVRCPYPYGRFECDGILQDREIESILPLEQFEQFLQRQFDAIRLNETDEIIILDDTSEEEEARDLPADLDLLVKLTDASIVPNPEPFDCPICFMPFKCYEGIILRDCFHTFCKDCLINSIKYAEDVVVRCPSQDSNNNVCETTIQDREIRTLLSEDEYNTYLGRSLRKAESMTENAFHCKTPDCTGWCEIADNVSLFECPVCLVSNCLWCKAIHTGMHCEEYQDRLSGNYENRRSERALQNMLDSGEGMRCPKCSAVVTKIMGCDYITCVMCKTGICWATRGLRWGPAGPGDTSGGCGCKINGRMCHPSCNNCH